MKIQTDCSKCVFAVEVEGEQDGCKQGRLAYFNDSGLTTKQENGYYLISRFCNTCRDKDSIGNDTVQSIRKEVSVRCGIIINCLNSTSLETTLNSIKRQTLKPVYIYCIFNSDIPGLSTLFTKYHTLFKDMDIVFNIKRYIEETNENEFITEICTKNVQNSQFVTYLHAGDELKKDYLDLIDKCVNDYMKRYHLFITDLESKKRTIKTFSAISVANFSYQNLEEEIKKQNEDYICYL